MASSASIIIIGVGGLHYRYNISEVKARSHSEICVIKNIKYLRCNEYWTLSDCKFSHDKLNIFAKGCHEGVNM